MKFQYCSDLHLEFADNRYYLEDHPLEVTGNVLLLAGDIITFGQIERYRVFFDWLSESYEMVYWIPGNHEYYGNDISRCTDSFSEAIRPNVILLNNESVVFAGVRLIFSTLWSHISLNNAWRVERSLNDFYQITLNGGTFDSSHYNELHKRSVEFLVDTLETRYNGPSIVITHHLPTLQNYPQEYKNDFLNEAFATHLDQLIEGIGPEYWVFGLHHRNVPGFCIGKTQMRTNQLGYVRGNEHWSFDNSAVIQL